MPSHYTRGFFVFDKTWIHENGFFQSLSHAEFRIMLYLLSSVLKITRRDRRYKRGDQIAMLYQHNNLLVANVSTPTIAERCSVSRGTVTPAINKFDEYGAAIRIPEGNDPGENNIYILGFSERSARYYEGRTDYYFVDSIAIKNGERMPEGIRRGITQRYAEEIFVPATRYWIELFGEPEGAQ